MATAKQVEANRRNAQLSTGPKTDEGKAISSGNAITHSYTSEDPKFTPTKDPAYQARYKSFKARLKPTCEVSEFLVSQIVVTSLKIEACEEDLRALKAFARERAEHNWDIDRENECVKLLKKIAIDPVVVSRRLQQSYHGAKLLIDQWTLLGENLCRTHKFTDEDRSKALDLLGHDPDYRVGRTPIDPPASHADPNQWIDNVMRKEAERLQEMIRQLAPSDELLRKQAFYGFNLYKSSDGRRLIRYDRELHRRFEKLWNEFHNLMGRAETAELPESPELSTETGPELATPDQPQASAIPPFGTRAVVPKTQLPTLFGQLAEGIAPEVLETIHAGINLQNVAAEEFNDSDDDNDYIDFDDEADEPAEISTVERLIRKMDRKRA
jgi:hypothetical protein